MKKVIIDCDPGVDDALAIVLAMTKSTLDIKAITTVVGNVSGDKTIRNAKLLLNALNSTIPLAKGSMKPLIKDHYPTDVHGADGLGDLSHTLPQEEYPYFIDKSAVAFMADILESEEEPITLIALGPLTNIALLLYTYPHLKSKIKEISIMGGGIDVGNVSEYAEFNVFVDPEAFHMVLNSEVPLVLSTLNATLKANLLEADMPMFEFVSTPMATFVHEIMWRYAKLDAAMHDPVSVLWVSNPEFFETKSAHLQVELNGEKQGMTYLVEDQAPNVRYISKLDRKQIITEIANSFKKIGNKS